MFRVKTFLLRYLLPFLGIYFFLTLFSFLPPVEQGIKNFARTQTGKVLNFTLPKALFISDPKRTNITELDGQISLAYGNKAVIYEQIKGKTNVGMDLKPIHFEVAPAYLIGLFFFLSLMLVTPIPWKRKLIAIAIGLCLLYLINSFNIYILALDRVAASEMDIYQLSDQKTARIKLLGNILNNAISFVVPVFIWGLLAFRKSDIDRLREIS